MAAATLSTWKGELRPPPTAAAARRGPRGCECCAEFHHDYERKISRPTKDTGIAFSNMVALEMSPGTPCADMMVMSYLGLMKSMIEDSKDVKALQEKGIIVSFVGESEEIVRMFKDIDSYGFESHPVFDEMKMRINDHCNSKAKTWIAELPWTAIALFAAAFLLCLTFLQTYYTINPRNT